MSRRAVHSGRSGRWAKNPRRTVSYLTLRDRFAAFQGDDAEHIITAPATRGRRRTPAPDAPTQREPRRCHNCERPVTTDDARSRCHDCTRKGTGADLAHRKEIADAIFSETTRTKLLQRLARGELLPDVCNELDLTPHRVHGYTAYDDIPGASSK
ncbi:hypothetical protein ACIBKX_36790 [Streptomyces sp. NPDC050658]|uniref:hypothetical protein n=1 Tax=unclassified Streptomyces TaxID=2593676 RepID=UPI00341A4EAE